MNGTSGRAGFPGVQVSLSLGVPCRNVCLLQGLEGPQGPPGLSGIAGTPGLNVRAQSVLM